ncbi:MAG: InlB B-repeat-containing protein [Clostridiales bacterium]|nr:InlB B-repeat-containing protein [Clostridiales bacterium]
MKKLVTLLAALCLMAGCVACLTACSGGKEYSVTCEACENGTVIVADTSVEAGENVILASHPDAGYRLATFIVDGVDLDGCSFVMPESDVSVSARFEVVTYTITYVVGDATVTGNNPDTYTVEDPTIELEAPVIDGYEICGWYRYYNENDPYIDPEEYRVKSLDGFYGSLTLYAKYYNVDHQISFGDFDGGDVDYDDNTEWEYYGWAHYGETIDLTVSTYDGYRLVSIYINGEPIDGTSFTMPMCDVEITAEFELIVYNITYVLDGGENAPENPDSYTIMDGYIVLQSASKDGYYFEGWYLSDDFSDESCVGMLLNPFEYLEDVTLYALFVKDEWSEAE